MKKDKRKELQEYIWTQYKNELKKEKRKKWLKIYSVLASHTDWKTTLFGKEEITSIDEELGVYRAKIIGKVKDIEMEYLVVEYDPGLILLITMATDEEYRKTLMERIKGRRGIFPMKIKPDLFRLAWKYFVDDRGYIYRFVSRREKDEEYPARIRPEYTRRFNYTGDDGGKVIEELKEMYGVRPQSIYVQLMEGQKVHLTTEGLFSTQEPSETTLNLFFDYLEEIKEEILRIKNVSESIESRFGNVGGIRTIGFTSGVINFQDVELDQYTIEKFPQVFSGFSFLDVNLSLDAQNMLDYTSIVIDNIKRTIFNISATEKQMILIPKHNMTFDSILEFYYGVVENIDSEAYLSILER